MLSNLLCSAFKADISGHNGMRMKPTLQDDSSASPLVLDQMQWLRSQHIAGGKERIGIQYSDPCTRMSALLFMCQHRHEPLASRGPERGRREEGGEECKEAFIVKGAEAYCESGGILCGKDVGVVIERGAEGSRMYIISRQVAHAPHIAANAP